MAHLNLASVTYALADGRLLLQDVSLAVGMSERVALIGANGAGKSTLLRIISGDLAPSSGRISRAGSMGFMRQFVTGETVNDLLLSFAHGGFVMQRHGLRGLRP